MKAKTILWSLLGLFVSQQTVAQPHHFKHADFQTDTPMVHDPVMAYEDSTWHIFATGMGIQHMTSKDRKTWTVKTNPVMSVIPQWTHDSVPGFRHHVWAPDVIKWHDRWWLAYSCSTFGRNGSAIGLLSTRSLASGLWDDMGCIVTSREGRDNWNAIDPNFVIDDQDQPWLVWGSFWDGIQLARLDTTMHVAKESGVRSQESVRPRTIARRFNMIDPEGKKALSVNPNPDLMRSKHPSSSSTTAGITSSSLGTTAVRVPKATIVWL